MTQTLRPQLRINLTLFFQGAIELVGLFLRPASHQPVQVVVEAIGTSMALLSGRTPQQSDGGTTEADTLPLRLSFDEAKDSGWNTTEDEDAGGESPQCRSISTREPGA